jgi:hypothetical protein
VSCSVIPEAQQQNVYFSTTEVSERQQLSDCGSSRAPPKRFIVMSCQCKVIVCAVDRGELSCRTFLLARREARALGPARQDLLPSLLIPATLLDPSNLILPFSFGPFILTAFSELELQNARKLELPFISLFAPSLSTKAILGAE